MQLPNLFSDISNNLAMYDEIYTQSWQDAIKQCEIKLERHDYERALLVRSLQDFRDELGKLLLEYPDNASTKAIALIHPTLDHYEIFARNFVNMMANPVDTSMMWGLLFLVFKLALGSIEQSSPLKEITRWLEKIGHELRGLNHCSNRITDFEDVKRDTVEVNKEIILLWLNIITTFRSTGGGGSRRITGHGFSTGNAWWNLQAKYKEAYQNITEAVKRIEKVAEMAERQAHRMSMLQSLLPLRNIQQDIATIPCNTLPVAENNRFYGRGDILEKIEHHLEPTNTSRRLSSMALYGLGGVGKTQIALAYAYQKVNDLDAVFWISAESSYSVQQSFSHVALSALKLPKATPQAYQENMILVLDWLQRTHTKWLLVFDNVDSHDALECCWPASKHGAILVTTRDPLIAASPIDNGLEVDEFDSEQGAEFLLFMAQNRLHLGAELEAARAVADILGGLPLALNQMAALINARNYSISQFHSMYAKYELRLHKEKKSGWKYLGYPHALDTVWEISFTSLGRHARACLGVLSFLAADYIPTEIFVSKKLSELPEILSFCGDELCMDDTMEELTHHALVRKNITQGGFRVHRLVQAEYRARMDNPQEEFEAAIKLILAKIPSQRSSKFDNEEWILYEKYIPQVLALIKNYNDSQTKPNPLKPNMDFVRLLTNSAYAIHDNDTLHVLPEILVTGDSAFRKCPKEERDGLLWALLQYLKCIYHFCTSEFAKSEIEMEESLKIRLELLPHDDLLIALSYNGLSMAVSAQGRYEEGLRWLLKAGKIYEGRGEENPSKKLIWCYNISRNYYCMGRHREAENILIHALTVADKLQSWYMQAYGHLTLASLRTRMDNLSEAKHHVEVAKELLESSGAAAHFSWLSSYCAYRAGDIAMKQGRFEEAIAETEKSAAIGKLVNIPTGILARCVHAYSKALATDPERWKESERQRIEARRLRSSLPDGGGDLDNESDEAFEKLVKMDHR